MRLMLSIIGLMSFCFAQETVLDISVKGISDAKNDGPQKDRQEAILDARRQACEKAGVAVQSKTTVENFQTTYDLVETRSEGVLLPGYQIVDIGYVQDGTYNVVLSGKVKAGKAPVSESAEFHLVLWLSEKKKDARTKTRLLDRLYERLTGLRASFDVNGKPLDAFEGDLKEILIRDSVSEMNRRYYAYVFRLPAGNLIYTQRTPATDGGTIGDDFKIKLRPGNRYCMHIAHANAAYFENPFEFDGTLADKRDFGTYPKGFSILSGKK